MGLSISSPEVLSTLEDLSLITNRGKNSGKHNFRVFKIHFFFNAFSSSVQGSLGEKFTFLANTLLKIQYYTNENPNLFLTSV